MPFVPLIRLNGRLFTRQSVSVRLNGLSLITGIDSIDWSDERPQELVGGMNMGGPPLGKATGNYTCASSLSVYLDEVLGFETSILTLSPLAGTDLSAANFDLSIVIREELRVHTVLLANCSIKGRENSVGNDGSAIVRKYTMQPTLSIENGLSLANLVPSI